MNLEELEELKGLKVLEEPEELEEPKERGEMSRHFPSLYPMRGVVYASSEGCRKRVYVCSFPLLFLNPY